MRPIAVYCMCRATLLQIKAARYYIKQPSFVSPERLELSTH